MDLPTEETEFLLAPRVGQSASMVSGSMTLSFHAKKMGNQTAKILKAKGKLVGKIEHGGNDDTPDRLIGKMERKPDHVLNVQVHGANGLAKMDNTSRQKWKNLYNASAYH